MAQQKGIVKFTGTLGGINFYYRKGVPIARMAGGGFTRQAIKTSPNMKRVREQNSEFAHCSRVNKIFKQALQTLLVDYTDGTLHSRLMRLFLQIKDMDGVSARGARSVWEGIQSTHGPSILQDFVFTPKRPLLLPCSYVFDWSGLSFSTHGFSVDAVDFPKGADFFELQLGLVRFDFEALSYTQEISAPLQITKGYTGGELTLSIPALPGGTGLPIALVRLAFYQELYGKRYVISGDGGFGLKIMDF